MTPCTKYSIVNMRSSDWRVRGVSTIPLTLVSDSVADNEILGRAFLLIARRVRRLAAVGEELGYVGLELEAAAETGGVRTMVSLIVMSNPDCPLMSRTSRWWVPVQESGNWNVKIL